jgi:RHS repeat-associated protein
MTHPEGRVVMTNSQEHQYHLKDHLGNVRMTITSRITPQTFTAGFESANQTTEATKFNNYPSSAYINNVATNAHAGTSSQYLSGGYNGQVGLAKSFSVMPGDLVSIQAYAKYNTPTSTPSNITAFAAALLSAFSLPTPGPGEVGTPSAALSSWGAGEAGGYGDGGTSTLKVFVNILIFDRNFVFKDVAYAPLVTSGALMSASYTVKEPGYVFMYISNEQPVITDCYFDDVTMTLTPSMVVQEQEYYPFGLTYNNYSRENSLIDRIKFQGQEHIDDLGLNWDSFKWRNHQPEIGRFFNVDPIASKYVYNSPYAFAENKLGLGRELEGLELAPFNPQTTHPFTIIAEGFRQAFDGILSMFQGEAKVYTKVSGTNGAVKTGNASATTSTSTETKAFVKVDFSKVMDNNGTNKPDVSNIVTSGVKTSTSQTTGATVTAPTPAGLPVNVTVSNTVNATDQTTAAKIEASAGIKRENFQANVYMNASTTVNNDGSSSTSGSAGVRAEVPIYKDDKRTIIIGAQAQITTNN